MTTERTPGALGSNDQLGQLVQRLNEPWLEPAIDADNEVQRLYRLCALAAAEIERLAVWHERYETARRMNPRQWADAWQLNISTGKPFDEILDDLRPFLRA
jgi:hypothetical protein